MPQLWNLAIKTVPALAMAIEELLADEAAAITVMIPPRQPNAQIDAIFTTVPEIDFWQTRLAIIAKVHNCSTPQIKISEVGNLDWLKKVATDFPPLPIARWTIHGAAHQPSLTRRHLALKIDATNAFGTGEHPTTRGCLLLLDKILRNQQLRLNQMLDVGCGSGILAMAFAKATHQKAIAVDLDPDAVRIARGNVSANGLSSSVRLGQSFGYRAGLVKKHRPYNLIMANIFARPLSLLAVQLKQHLRPGGVAILAGLLTTQANAVLAAHRAQGLALLYRMRIGEWTVLALKRPNQHNQRHDS